MGSGTVSTQREHTYIAIDLKSFYVILNGGLLVQYQ